MKELISEIQSSNPKTVGQIAAIARRHNFNPEYYLGKRFRYRSPELQLAAVAQVMFLDSEDEDISLNNEELCCVVRNAHLLQADIADGGFLSFWQAFNTDYVLSDIYDETTVLSDDELDRIKNAEIVAEPSFYLSSQATTLYKDKNGFFAVWENINNDKSRMSDVSDSQAKETLESIRQTDDDDLIFKLLDNLIS